MRRHYPTVEAFNDERFGDCPIKLIELALKGLEDEIQTERFWQAYPIAELGRHISAGNGAKDPKSEWFNPHEGVMRSRSSEIPAGTAKKILELVKRNKLPLWAAEYLNFEQLRAAADGR